MKKRIFSLLLVLAMLVTVSVFAVEATEPQGTAFDEASAVDGVVTAYCEACKQDVQWTKATLADGAIVVSDHMYISEEGLATTAAAAIGGKVCLYLNGTVTHSGTTALFSFTTEATEETDIILSVMGHAENGKIVSSASAPVFDMAKNTSGGRTGLNMYSGTVDAKASTATRGAVFCEYSSSVDTSELNMYGGTFYGSTTEKTKNGGAVYMAKGTFNMSDGTIDGGKIKDTSSLYGGNVYLAAGSNFIMSGGIIKNGKVSSATYIGGYGGNVAIAKNSTFTMTGGTIQDGYVSIYSASSTRNAFKAYGGNVYFGESCEVEISGNAKITGGEARCKIAAKGGNIYFAAKADVTISGNAQITGGKTTLVNSATSVTYDGSKVSTTSYGGNISFNGGTLDMQGGTISGGSCYNEASKKYTITTSRGGNLHIAGGTVTISGGKLYNQNDSAVAWFGGNICLSSSSAVMNIDGAGAELVGGRASRGGTIGHSAGTLNIKNGTIRGGSAVDTGGCIHSESTVNMTGGKITDALDTDELTNAVSAGENGGSVYVGAGTFTLDGADAVIEGGECNYGATISIGQSYYASGKYGAFALKNGTINGGKATKQGGAIQVRSGGECTISGGTVNPGTAGTNGEALVVNGTGLLTIANGLTSRLDVVFDDSSIVDNKVSTTKVTVDGYTNGGMVVYARGGVKYPVVGSGTELVLAQSAVVNGDDIVSIPETAQAAVETDLAAGQYVKLFNAAAAALDITKDTYLDINGNAVTLNIADGVKLYGMDTATNDYDDTDAGVVTLADGSAAPQFNTVIDLTIDGQQGQRKYVYLQNGFHRYYVAQRNLGIRVNEDDACPDLIFSGTFRGTQTLAANVESFGINFQDTEGNNKMIDYMSHGQTFTPTNLIYGKNINITITEAQAKEWGEKMFRGVPYIKITGSDELLTPTNISAPTSVQEQVAYFCNNYATLKASQQTLVDAMIEKSKALFDECGWNYSKAV